ncbi:MAG: hypothetical protein PWP23_1075 [Candidatus Sumerlaeota bacterium]|nr:hypothetical protein [Candidatus Sumerlaeota bacterium]
MSGHLLAAIRRLNPPPRLRVFVKNDMPLARPHAYGYGHLPLFLRTPVFAMQAAAYLLARRPRLLVTTHANLAPLARIAAGIRRVPYWVVAHGVEVWSPAARVRFGLAGAERILCVSRHTRDRIVAVHEVDPSRCVVLPNALDAKRFRPGLRPHALAKRLGIRADERVLLTVSRLGASERPKGVERVLTALPAVLRECPGVRYVIVGDGDGRAALEKKARRLGLGEVVVFAGRVSDEDLVACYNLCDHFVMPSTKEGFGIVFLEALACGKPVIAARGDGSAEPLVDGALGLLIDPTDAEALSRAIVSVLNGTHGHPLLGDPVALRREAIARFGFPAFVRRLQALADASDV